MKHWAWAILLVAVFGLTAGGLPTFSTQSVLNNMDVYDGGGNRITSATHSGVELRAYVDGAADTSAAGSYYDLTEDSDGSWYPSTTVDTTTTVNVYRIDSAVDTLLASGFVFVGRYSPKGWVTTDAIEADAVDSTKIASVSGSVITDATITSGKYGAASVPATALQSNAARDNLISGTAAVDLAHSDGADGLGDSTHVKLDTLTVYQSLTIDNLLTTDQPGAGSDGELRIASADLYALGDVYLTSTQSEKVEIDGYVTIGDSLSMGTAGDTTTVHPVTGFLRHLNAVEITVPSSTSSGSSAFPGATADMVFLALPKDGNPGGNITGKTLAVEYLSDGWIEWIAVSNLSSREFIILGFKF